MRRGRCGKEGDVWGEEEGRWYTLHVHVQEQVTNTCTSNCSYKRSGIHVYPRPHAKACGCVWPIMGAARHVAAVPRTRTNG